MNEFYNHHPGRPEPHPHGRPEPHPEYRPTPPFYDHPEPGYCIPPIPPCKPYVPGFSPEEQMGILTGKVNEMIDLFNRSQMDMWGAYHTIVESALTNDAYYNEITVEEGYIAEAGAPYKVVHIPFLDRAKQPIYLELGLAYNNTTNANVHEDVFSASERVLADKLIPAYQSTNTWYGAVVWKGAPISNIGENPAPYTVGITDHGFIKIYENLMNYTQLKQDNVRNAMLANCVLVQGGAMTPDKFEPDEKGQMLGRVGIGMNYDTKERFMVIVNGSDQSGCTAEMLANIFLKYNCTVAVEVANGMKTVGVDKGALMFTPPTVAGDEVPTIPEVNAFWYITKRRHYKNEYVKDVASLTQKYGQMLWRCETANISVDNVKETVAELSQKLDTEISDREEADAHLQEQITQEVSDREQAIQTVNERIDTEVETLNNLIQSTKTELQNNIDTLDSKVEQYHTELNDKDIKEVELIQDQTKDTYRIKLNDGTAIDIPMEVYNYELLVQKLAQLSNLETVLDNEIETRQEKDAEHDAAIQKNAEDILAKVSKAGDTMTGNLNMGGNTVTGLKDPVAATDAVTLDYFNKNKEAGGGVYLEIAGGTMGGNINMSGNKIVNLPTPTGDNDPATKAYTDSKITEVNASIENIENQLDGSNPMPGDMNMGDHKITGVADPTEPDDAANKNYVDNSIAEAIEEAPFIKPDGSTPFTGDINMGGHKVTNIGTPEADTDAANKGYVDDAIGGLSGIYLPKAGGTMTGSLVLAANPTENLQAATKQYVDQSIGSAVGGDFMASGAVPMTGNLQMGGHSIVNVAEPVNATDAANKQYVDDEVSEVQNQFEQAQHVYVIDHLSGVTVQTLWDNKDKFVLYASEGKIQGYYTIAQADAVYNVTKVSFDPVASIAYNGVALTDTITELTETSGYTIQHTGTNVIGISAVGYDAVKIEGVDTPTANTDAVNKEYVDGLIASINAQLANKADSSTVTALTATVNGKADQTTVTALQNTVNSKANQSALDATNGRVTTLESWKNTYNGVIQTLYNG